MHAIDLMAQKITALSGDWLSPSAQVSCHRLIADLMAAVAGGVDSDLAAATCSAAEALYGTGPVSIWLTQKTSSIVGAAMANAAAASALDIDDGHRGAAGHPGAGIIPAALAVGQALDAPATQIIAAIVLGYETGLRVAASRPTSTIETYCSGRWITVGSAVAAGYLLGLEAEALANAMAIALAEGPIGVPPAHSAYQATSVKESIPPAVVVGLTAAFRARQGATGPRDLLDNADRFVPTVLLDGFGDRWAVEDCYLKPYACCRWIHGAIDAVIALRRPGHPIRSLRIETFTQGLRLANERAPVSLEGAQYSYPFACALAACHGSGALLPIDPTTLQDPAVLALAKRIDLIAHDDFAGMFPAQTPSRVILDQGDGLEECLVVYPLGDVANPMSRAQIATKLERLWPASLTREQALRVQTALDGLNSGGFRALFAALVPNFTS